MSKVIKIYRREALFIKKDTLSKSEYKKIEKRHTHLFYDEKACKECDNLPDKLGTEGVADCCAECGAFKGGVCLVKDEKIGDNVYVSIPGGSKESIKEVLKRPIKIENKTIKHKFRRPIEFTGELRGHQVPAVEAIMTKKFGVIKAPPRSGKTVLSTAAVCRIGAKTIILAAQREWLDGFYETFCGSKTQKALTTAKKSQVGFAKTIEDFKRLDVCLVTYQTFNSSKGKRLLRKIRDMFTVCIVDEVHMGAAENFAICMSKLNVRYKIGLSGTPSRKDRRYIIAESLIGPIIYVAKVKQLRPQVRLTKTAYTKTSKGRPQWATMVKHLETDPKRLMLIAKCALKDVRDGHMILIPLSQITPIKALVKAINRLAGKKIAHEFHGSVKKPLRKQLIEDARNYKVRILVGNAKLVSVGINIPRASCLYDCFMSSNLENAEQRTARILTAYDGKPPPMLRIFLDDYNVRRNCLRTEWYGAVVPKFKPILTEKDQIVLKNYFKQKEQRTSFMDLNSSTGQRKSRGQPAWEM